MLDFVKNAFRGLFPVLLWLNLILSTIGGGIIGYSSFRHPIIGVIIGFIAGLLTNIVGGGLAATILNIDENIEYLRENSYKTGTPNSGISSGININKTPPISPVVTTGDTWVCRTCNQRNPITSSSCKGCGAYK